MVLIVTSRARSLRNPTQQDFIHARTLPIYKCHTRFADTFYTKIPIAPCYCQMMGRTLKDEIKITQYNNPTKAGKYSLEDLFRASDNIPHHYPKL